MKFWKITQQLKTSAKKKRMKFEGEFEIATKQAVTASVAIRTPSKDPISEKKMIKKDGQWRIEKDVLGWTFEGEEKTMVLEAEKIQFILGILKDWCRAKTGIPFATFHKKCCKVQHASKGIPAIKGLSTPINQIFGKRPEPSLVWVRPGSKF